MVSNNFSPRKHPATSPEQHPSSVQKTRELALHDGLDRLEDFTLMLAFQSYGCQFEILSITPPPDCPESAPVRSSDDTNSSIVSLHAARLKKTA